MPYLYPRSGLISPAVFAKFRVQGLRFRVQGRAPGMQVSPHGLPVALAQSGATRYGYRSSEALHCQVCCLVTG